MPKARQRQQPRPPAVPGPVYYRVVLRVTDTCVNKEGCIEQPLERKQIVDYLEHCGFEGVTLEVQHLGDWDKDMPYWCIPQRVIAAPPRSSQPLHSDQELGDAAERTARQRHAGSAGKRRNSGEREMLPGGIRAPKWRQAKDDADIAEARAAMEAEDA